MNKCLQCGKEYKPVRTSSKFCSSNCRVAYNRVSVTIEKENLSVTDKNDLSVTDNNERYILDSNGKIQTANNGLIARIGKCHNCGENVPDTICICYDCFHKKGATHENLGLAMCTPID